MNQTRATSATTERKAETPRHMAGHQALKRYPLLTGFLICESLGYFSAASAANVIADHASGRGNACEWFLCMRDATGKSLEEVGRATLQRAFRNRHRRRNCYPKDLAWARQDVAQLLETYAGTEGTDLRRRKSGRPQNSRPGT